MTVGSDCSPSRRIDVTPLRHLVGMGRPAVAGEVDLIEPYKRRFLCGAGAGRREFNRGVYLVERRHLLPAVIAVAILGRDRGYSR